MARIKYIRTKEDTIIVFSELFEHSKFANFNPISAGFVSFGTDKDGELNCTCYGYSASLKLESKGEEDAGLVKMEILGYKYY